MAICEEMPWHGVLADGSVGLQIAELSQVAFWFVQETTSLETCAKLRNLPAVRTGFQNQAKVIDRPSVKIQEIYSGASNRERG